MLTKKVPKSSKNYECKMCAYNTVRKSQFARHLLTAKHCQLTSLTEKVPKSSNSDFMCEYCNKHYKSRVGLWKHKRLCSDEIDTKQSIINGQLKQHNPESDTIIELIKQNQEFKELIIEQNKHIVELAQKPTTTNNQTINHNQKFNLNVFLNEQCKDAINMSEFLEDMELNMEDLTETGRLGYVNGISRILVNKLRELDTYKRPLHCTDLKRETLYIKENDEWSRENDSKEALKGLVNKVANKNCKNIEQWRDEHPEYQIFDSPHNVEYMKLCNIVLGGIGEQENKQFRDKIVRSVIKEVLVNKI